MNEYNSDHKVGEPFFDREYAGEKRIPKKGEGYLFNGNFYIARRNMKKTRIDNGCREIIRPKITL